MPVHGPRPAERAGAGWGRGWGAPRGPPPGSIPAGPAAGRAARAPPAARPRPRGTPAAPAGPVRRRRACSGGAAAWWSESSRRWRKVTVAGGAAVGLGRPGGAIQGAVCRASHVPSASPPRPSVAPGAFPPHAKSFSPLRGTRLSPHVSARARFTGSTWSLSPPVAYAHAPIRPALPSDHTLLWPPVQSCGPSRSLSPSLGPRPVCAPSAPCQDTPRHPSPPPLAAPPRRPPAPPPLAACPPRPCRPRPALRPHTWHRNLGAAITAPHRPDSTRRRGGAAGDQDRRRGGRARLREHGLDLRSGRVMRRPGPRLGRAVEHRRHHPRRRRRVRRVHLLAGRVSSGAPPPLMRTACGARRYPAQDACQGQPAMRNESGYIGL
jgi:hypothetical protein